MILPKCLCPCNPCQTSIPPKRQDDTCKTENTDYRGLVLLKPIIHIT